MDQCCCYGVRSFLLARSLSLWSVFFVPWTTKSNNCYTFWFRPSSNYAIHRTTIYLAWIPKSQRAQRSKHIGDIPWLNHRGSTHEQPPHLSLGRPTIRTGGSPFKILPKNNGMFHCLKRRFANKSIIWLFLVLEWGPARQGNYFTRKDLNGVEATNCWWHSLHSQRIFHVIFLQFEPFVSSEDYGMPSILTRNQRSKN